MTRHWKGTADAYNHFSNISGWSWHTIKKWRYQLELPDNRVKHETITNSKNKTRVSR